MRGEKRDGGAKEQQMGPSHSIEQLEERCPLAWKALLLTRLLWLPR